MPDQSERIWTCTARNENGSCGPTHYLKAASEREAAKRSFGSDAYVIDGKVYTEMLGFVGWISVAREFAWC